MDIMLPKINGFEVVKMIRAEGDRTPVLFLTARDTVEDIVHGLDIGGNDYLIKPFSFEELLARIRVITRNKDQGYASVHTLADLKVDSAARTVYRGDREIELSPKEFALLEYMIINKGGIEPRGHRGSHIRRGLRGRLKRSECIHKIPAPKDRRALRKEAHTYRPGLRICIKGRIAYGKE